MVTADWASTNEWVREKHVQSVVVAGMAFSGFEWVSGALAHAGVPTVMASPVAVARCTTHAAKRAVAESLADHQGRAGIVFVYRNPWDTAMASLDSEQPRLVADPGVARRAWHAYHEALVDYVADSGEKVWLVSSDALAADESLLGNLVARSGKHVDAPQPAAGESQVLDTAQVQAPSRAADDPIGVLYRTLYPELTDMLARLAEISVVPIELGEAAATSKPAHVLPGGSLPEGTGIQVVLPCRNDGRFIAEAVASIARSSPEPVELTIVDDGSNDPETLRIMGCLMDVGYQVIRTQGVGLSAARNAGAATSCTTAVLPLDADNVLRAAMFDGLSFITKGAADVVYGPVQYFGMKHHVFRPPALSWSNALPYNTVDACALVRRDLLDQIGGWDPEFRLWEDWDLWVSALEVGARFLPVSEVTLDYCVRPGSLQRSAGADQAIRAETHRQLVYKHRAGLEPWLLDAFIEFDEQRAELKRALARSLAENDLLRRRLDLERHESSPLEHESSPIGYTQRPNT